MNPEDTPLEVLLVEDSAADAELLGVELERGARQVHCRRVVSRRDFEAALLEAPQVILSDYQLPGWDGLEALSLSRARYPGVPFILVSGNVGEEKAVEAILRGADDYVLKDRMARLVPAIEAALERRRLREDARRAENRYVTMFECAPIGVALNTLDGRLISANPALAQMLGYSSPAALAAALAPGLQGIYHDPGERTRFVLELRAHGEVRGFETELRHADGSALWVALRARLLDPAAGDSALAVVMAEDISERRRREAHIARLSRVQAMLVAMSSAIVQVRERRTLYAEVCRIALDHGGFRMAWIARIDAATGIGTPAAWAGIEDGFLAGRTISPDPGVPAGAGAGGGALRARHTVVDNDIAGNAGLGLVRDEALRRGYRSVVALPILVDGDPAAVLLLYATEPGFFSPDELLVLETLAGDLSFALESIVKGERLEFLARHDALTRLPNRAMLVERMEAQLPAVHRAGSRSALMLVDVNRFQDVNASLGRAAGDALLVEAGRRLRAALRESDVVARIGPNRFAAFVSDLQQEEDIGPVLDQKVLGGFRVPFTTGATEVSVDVRAGIALHPGDGWGAEELLKNAEAALRRAKATGQRYVFYAPELTARVAERLALASRLQNALKRRDFLLHYQPKVVLPSGLPDSLEALLRLRAADGSLVSPAQFIPLLEETGLIAEVGRWAIGEALAERARWDARGIAAGRVAVNVSALQLREKEFVGSVVEVLEQAGDGAAERLELEITESVLMHDFDASARKLSILRGMGVTVAMDDFGTGYCSLNYLARLPIDTVKIDRSLVSGIAEDRRGAAVVASVISLAHALGLSVVAEGVETREQAAALARLGCNFAQGYLFSRPVAAAEIDALYASGTRSVARGG